MNFDVLHIYDMLISIVLLLRGDNMSDFFSRLDECRKIKGYSKSQLNKELGLSSNAIYNWQVRGTIPAGDIVLKMANILDTTVDYLLTGEEAEQKEKPLPDTIKAELNDIFEQLSEDQKKKALSFMKNMKDHPDLW